MHKRNNNFHIVVTTDVQTASISEIRSQPHTIPDTFTVTVTVAVTFRVTDTQGSADRVSDGFDNMHVACPIHRFCNSNTTNAGETGRTDTCSKAFSRGNCIVGDTVRAVKFYEGREGGCVKFFIMKNIRRAVEPEKRTKKLIELLKIRQS